MDITETNSGSWLVCGSYLGRKFVAETGSAIEAFIVGMLMVKEIINSKRIN